MIDTETAVFAMGIILLILVVRRPRVLAAFPGFVALGILGLALYAMTNWTAISEHLAVLMRVR